MSDLITREVLEQLRTPGGSYDKPTILALGLNFPLRSGWRDRLIGKPIPLALMPRLGVRKEPSRDDYLLTARPPERQKPEPMPEGWTVTHSDDAQTYTITRDGSDRVDGVLHFDGACWPNPGPASGAFILRCNGNAIERKLSFGQGTNNIAEYSSLIEGLKAAIEHGITHLEVYGDSLLVIRGVAKMRKWCKGKIHLEKLRAEAIDLVKRFQRVELHWVCREANAECDAISR